MLDAARRLCRAGWFEPALLSPLAGGRINDTIGVTDQAQRRFVLQRLSEAVFTDQSQLMAQVARVSAHLARTAPGWAPELVPSRAGHASLEQGGAHWRMWRFVPGESLQARAAAHLLPQRLEAAGHAFGRTQVLLEDVPGGPLRSAIPHHHDLRHHLARFDEIAPAVSDEWRRRIDELRTFAERFGQPDGPIHGDCKPDNLLFEAGSARVAAVLDLDTIMVANRALDFGDLVRSSVWHWERYEHRYFERLARGFVGAQRDSRAPSPFEDLSAAPRYVSAMLALRYLVDHHSGNRVFKIERHGDNLVRAERQHRRTLRLEAAARQMNEALGSLLSAGESAQ